MSPVTPDPRERFRRWKKALKPPRALRRPLLYLFFLAGLGVLGVEVVAAVRRLLAGGA